VGKFAHRFDPRGQLKAVPTLPGWDWLRGLQSRAPAVPALVVGYTDDC